MLIADILVLENEARGLTNQIELFEVVKTKVPDYSDLMVELMDLET